MGKCPLSKRQSPADMGQCPLSKTQSPTDVSQHSLSKGKSSLDVRGGILRFFPYPFCYPDAKAPASGQGF